MKSVLKYVWALAAVIFLLTSCQKDEELLMPRTLDKGSSKTTSGDALPQKDTNPGALYQNSDDNGNGGSGGITDEDDEDDDDDDDSRRKGNPN